MNGSLDWFKHHVDIFAENGLSPPEECLCNPNTFDDCEMVEFTIPVTDNGIFDVSVTAKYNAWERVRLVYMRRFHNNKNDGYWVKVYTH